MSRSSRSALRSPLARQANRLPWLGGICWILTVVFFIGQIVAQSAWPSFSLFDNHVSDLGNTACGPWLAYPYICSPFHAVMNTALVITGVLMVLGLLCTRGLWPRRRLTTWGFSLLTLAGLCTILVGLNPENVNLPLHLLGALNIPFANIAVLLFGLATWNAHRWEAKLSVALATIGWLGLPVGLLLLALTGHGGGLAERLALYPVVVWMILLGISFVRRSEQDLRQAFPGPANDQLQLGASTR